MGALTADFRSFGHDHASNGGGTFPSAGSSPRCLSGLSSIVAQAELRSSAALPTPPIPGPGRRPRLKLWEIDRSWHCGLLGLCLGAVELRAIAAKHDSVKAKARSASDFDLHVAVLRFACRDRDLGKALTKALDRKYARVIAQIAAIDDSGQLLTQWQALTANGELAAAYWALMAHSAASDERRLEISGDVHMQLYQIEAASRADRRRLLTLERENAEAEAKAARKVAQVREELSRKECEIDELRRRLDRPQDKGDTAQANDLRRQLEIAAARHRADEDAARQALAELRELRGRVERLAARNDHLEAENAALSRGDEPWGDDTPSVEATDLEGRTILLVGGRTQHVPHYRRLVERRNGCFIHHDGGVDDSIARLRGLFGRADAVLFPVDCVSHMAQDELKKLCRRWEKPYVPVRRSGLAAFQVALDTAASAVPDTIRPPAA